METNLGQIVLVKDIDPGSNDSSPLDFIEFNNKLYFYAEDGSEKRSLWVSDGTVTGTQIVKENLSPTIGRFGPFPSNFTELNDKLYFNADDGINGNELWVSDGTAEGTELVKDINTGSSFPGNFVEFNNKLYFYASTFSEGGQLWVSDGTESGTQLVKEDIFPFSSPKDGLISPNFSEFKNEFYFFASDGTNSGLWTSNGTTTGTQFVKNLDSVPSRYGCYLGGFTEFKDKLYFSADDGVNRDGANGIVFGVNGNELFVTDGTPAGTQLVKDIYPGTFEAQFGEPVPNSSSPRNFTEFNDKLYFTARDETTPRNETGRNLWVTDGSAVRS